MEETMPQRWVSDPSFEFVTSPEPDEIMARMMQKDREQDVMNSVSVFLKKMLEPLRDYTCSYISSILGR
jgi:hypothetical protein